MERDEILGRYRTWRDICLEHHNAALNHLSRSGLMESARRLGMAEGRNALVGSDEELTLTVDLALYTSRNGRSRALDRYAKSARLAPESPEAIMLAAMQRARYSFWEIRERHPDAGVIVEDFFTDEPAWLVDLGLEEYATIGSIVAARVCKPDTFSLTNGVTLPINLEVVEEFLAANPWFDDGPERFPGDTRLTTAVYRVFMDLAILAQEPPEGPADQLLDMTFGAVSSQRAGTGVPGSTR